MLFPVPTFVAYVKSLVMMDRDLGSNFNFSNSVFPASANTSSGGSSNVHEVVEPKKFNGSIAYG